MSTYNSVVSSSTSKFEKNPISCLEKAIEPLMLNAPIDFDVYVLIFNLMHKSVVLHKSPTPFLLKFNSYKIVW